MTSSNRHLLSIALTLLLCAMLSVKGRLEFKYLKLCGPSNPKNTEIKVSPWPIIPSGTPFNVTIAFTPAQDIFAVTSRCLFTSEPDGRILARSVDDLCSQDPELKICSLPANEKFVWNYSDKLQTFPPGFNMTVKAEATFYNEEDIEFFCVKAVAKILH